MDAKARGNDDDDRSASAALSSIKKKLNRSVSDVCNNNSNNSKDGFIFGSWKCRRNSKKTRVDANGSQDRRDDNEYATVDRGSIAAAATQVRRRVKPRPSSVHDQLREQDFWCPRCGGKMEEPRLLPCLHSVCSACVNEFMSKHYYGDDDDDDDGEHHLYSRLRLRASGSSRSLKSGQRRRRPEGCPRCEHPLPRHGSGQSPPPPHYSLQHRLVIYAVRRRLSQRAICCDACPQERQATQHCSRCLCNFCDECGAQHEHQEGAVRPLWQAKRIRRLAVCLEHPAHSLRYHCLACKRATCKECMWTPAHRGHAAEDASRAGARARLRLEAALGEARRLLELLLLRETERQREHGSAGQAALDFVLKDGWQQRTTTTTKSPPEQRSRSSASTQSREARQRILEYSRLKRAKYLMEAIFIAEDLLANGSVVEILSLKRIILKRLRFLGLDVDDSDAPDGRSDRVKSATTNTTTMHSGIFHCCTFCSSGGKKDVACACGGTMPGGYRGCGHGHSGHPGERHWSCCGSTTRDGTCLSPRRCTYKLII
ncbi:tripartite motif-containing protein 45-like [Trichogramma pretiosum]|uniref:tripartite motif-containing protein 45-like n=1 Tax=Trichogramma pretiosum TaxID=7493 RepID=UPI0006C96128|nr:tripartite motif-containing protein 45-like [Trichogramma pretiosum]XP_014227282.1 tripartite motif-containing protein 45-like [Trichogramma pretiosum]XP_014227283.1 tripartite motif-containing protein 45-like [Trichogramma pretiosum]